MLQQTFFQLNPISDVLIVVIPLSEVIIIILCVIKKNSNNNKKARQPINKMKRSQIKINHVFSLGNSFVFE